MKSETVRKGYNKIALKYHKQRGKYPNKILIAKILKHLPKGGNVLDIGCGAGVPVSKFLANKGYKVTGIDFSSSMIKLARKNVPKGRFVKMDMAKMKFPSNSFDGAVSFYAIIHVPREKHRQIYRSLHGILKPDAFILVNASGGDRWESTEEYMGVQMFWSHYGPRLTPKIIKDAGFEITWSKVLKLGGERQFWVLARNIK